LAALGEDRSKPPLERRVPGATRAGPASTSRPELPEALLQRMQAVVNAAHARAVQEEEERRQREGQPDQAARPGAPESLPRRVPGTAGEPKPTNGVPWTKLPAARRGRLSDEDSEFDTDPFLPRLTASGAVASPPASKPGAPPHHTAHTNGSAPPADTAQGNGVAQQDDTTRRDDTVRPDHARRRDRALRRRDRRAGKQNRPGEAGRAEAERERTAQAERERTAQAERERAAQAEREQAAQAERERAAQAEREQAERQRAAQAEREQAAQAERERAAQAERERAERAERERAAQAERERAERAVQAQRERGAQAEREQAERQRAERERAAAAAWTERERAAQAEHAQAGHVAPERADQAQRAAPPDQARPEQPVPPSGSAQPDHSAPSADLRTAAAGRAPADQPWRPLNVRRAPGRRRTRTIALVVGAAAVLAVGPLVLALSHSGPPKLSAAEAARDQAAAWVAQQVRNGDVVSCDVAMCLALKAHGISVTDLLVMSTKARDPLTSQVIVSTAAIRQLFGSSLDTVYAPTVLASFGSGNTRIDVRVIAPDGAAKYLSALRTDWQQRKSAGAATAGNPRITLAAAARRQMDAGEVDAQLLLMLADLASQHPVDVLAFGDLAPGASPGVPLRSAILAENGAANLRSMLANVHAQRGPYQAAHVETTRRDGQPVLVIEFAAPVPLGLINGLSP
jgi:hypothetical protein